MSVIVRWSSGNRAAVTDASRSSLPSSPPFTMYAPSAHSKSAIAPVTSSLAFSGRSMFDASIR